MPVITGMAVLIDGATFCGGHETPLDGRTPLRLAAHLREPDEETDNLRITRRTLPGLADEPPVTEAAPQPANPPHRTIRPTSRSWPSSPTRAGRCGPGTCEALDLPILPKNTEGIRFKPKRMVSRGILTEPEPDLFAQPHP